jgi:hypothetical protein
MDTRFDAISRAAGGSVLDGRVDDTRVDDEKGLGLGLSTWRN